MPCTSAQHACHRAFAALWRPEWSVRLTHSRACAFCSHASGAGSDAPFCVVGHVRDTLCIAASCFQGTLIGCVKRHSDIGSKICKSPTPPSCLVFIVEQPLDVALLGLHSSSSLQWRMRGRKCIFVLQRSGIVFFSHTVQGEGRADTVGEKGRERERPPKLCLKKNQYQSHRGDCDWKP